MNTLSSFTELLPKHPEVTGTPDQIFSYAKDFGTMVLKLIESKTIAALGTVTPGSVTANIVLSVKSIVHM
jgi:hypothetical protein